MSNTSSTSSGIGFFGLLTIVFIVLKLTKFIAWSWYYVLMPVWIPFAIGIGFLFIAGLLGLFQHFRKK
ncbi:hypothetical protein SAMN05421847_2160 [Halpernia humi]|uniref:Uncharacterized protein n=1 Tax=Halpernia humi TaxID=493375 RepID=A0A1H5ZRQ8_9FLAO|nr:hypothetical protein [Halpernia humi]SEG38860.1 hypothetical protein SAMN05421847_2160 [Halpernia humi]